MSVVLKFCLNDYLVSVEKGLAEQQSKLNKVSVFKVEVKVILWLFDSVLPRVKTHSNLP